MAASAASPQDFEIINDDSVDLHSRQGQASTSSVLPRGFRAGKRARLSSGCDRQRNGLQGNSNHRSGGSVIDLTSHGDDDDDVVVVGTPRRTAAPVIKKRGRMVDKRTPTPASAPSTAATVATPEIGYKCPICLERIEHMVSTPCGHVFCESCLTSAVKAMKKCPKCRKSVQMRQIHRIFLS